MEEVVEEQEDTNWNYILTTKEIMAISFNFVKGLQVSTSQ